MKLAAAFLIGMTVTIAIGWPRVTPEVRYFADGDSLWYHKTADNGHGAVITFRSREEAEEANLIPCPICFPEDQSKVVNK